MLFEVFVLKVELLPSLLWSSSTVKRTFFQSPNTFILKISCLSLRFKMQLKASFEILSRAQ